MRGAHKGIRHFPGMEDDMVELVNLLQKITTDDVRKMVISKPALKKFRYKKIVIEKREAYYQACSYTEKQVFHENIPRIAYI